MAEITYYRGDSYPIPFSLTVESTGAALPISGYSFKLTVNAERDPTPSETAEFQVVGSITDAANGEVSFTPTTSDTDPTPDTYWYDVQMTDGSGNIRTIAKDKFIITMDITK